MKRTLVVVLALAGLLAPHDALAHSRRPAQRIHIGEGYTATFDARAGDVIIVTMNPESTDAGDPYTRCLNMGGNPRWNKWTEITTCIGVDF